MQESCETCRRLTGTRTVYYVANRYQEGMGGTSSYDTLEEAEQHRQEMKRLGYRNVHVWRKTVEYIEEPRDLPEANTSGTHSEDYATSTEQPRCELVQSQPAPPERQRRA